MPSKLGSYFAYSVLAAGVLLRIALGLVTPPDEAHDDHITPVRLLLEKGRLPDPNDCWQCYQPPLFYVISASVFSGVRSAAGGFGASPENAIMAALEGVQFVSVFAGCATLFVCFAILRRVCPAAPAPPAIARPGAAPPAAALAGDHGTRTRPPPTVAQALGLAVIAFLPQHVYMSVMITNDAITYFCASLAIWGALRAHAAGWPVGRAALTGLFCGAAVLAKAYGMVTVIAVVACAGLALALAALGAGLGRGAARGRRPWLGFATLLIVTAVMGAWPSVRNLRLYGRPHIDNYQIHKTAMAVQPPGAVQRIDFMSFRFGRLLRFPWVHRSHVDSYWTELYARFWFDYEGMTFSLKRSSEWLQHRARSAARYGGQWSEVTWQTILNWNAENVPRRYWWVALTGYIAGLPLTLLVLVGAVQALRRLGQFGVALLLVHFVGSLCVPLVQTLRLPVFAAMKSAFALSALSSVPVFVVLAVGVVPERWRRGVLLIGWAAVAAVALADIGFTFAKHQIS